MNVDINDLLFELKNKLENNISNVNKILSFENKRLDSKEIEMFSNISTDINNLSDKIDEFYFTILDKTQIDKTAEEIIKLREIKINNKIQKILLPYMFYMKIILENNPN